MKNKDRYQLSKLKAKFSVTCNGVDLFDGVNHIAHLDTYEELFCWLEKEHLPLTIKEEAYLKGVIRPWLNEWRVKYIRKNKWLFTDDINREYISITIYDKGLHSWYVYLPPFEKGTMYEGMELGKEYSLEELGL